MSNDERFRIAPASWRDFREILALERLCFPRDPWPWFDVLAALTFPETVRLRGVLPEPTSDTSVESLPPGDKAPEKQTVGFVIGDRRRLQKLGWVASIGVHPGYQRRGLGAMLLAACERALGTPRVRLTLRPSNLAALRLYQAAGYLEIGTLKRYYMDGEDGIIMEKVVSGQR
jgi:ribosomal-protein-alanine N-acetyltransferase